MVAQMDDLKAQHWVASSDTKLALMKADYLAHGWVSDLVAMKGHHSAESTAVNSVSSSAERWEFVTDLNWAAHLETRKAVELAATLVEQKAISSE
jgi:hypothetical protein